MAVTVGTEVGILALDYEGPALGVKAMGEFHIILAELFQLVEAEAAGNDPYICSLMPSSGKWRILSDPSRPLVRAEITSIHSGSLHEQIVFIATSPEFRSLATTMGAEVIKALIASGVSWIRDGGLRRKLKDPYGVSGALGKLVETIMTNNPGEDAELRLHYTRSGDGEEMEVVMKIPRNKAG